MHFVIITSWPPHPSPRTEGKRLKLFPDLADQNKPWPTTFERIWFLCCAAKRFCSGCGFAVDVKRRTFEWTSTETWLIESLKYHSSRTRGIFIKTELHLPEFWTRSLGVPVELMTDVIWFNLQVCEAKCWAWDRFYGSYCGAWVSTAHEKKVYSVVVRNLRVWLSSISLWVSAQNNRL